MKNTDKIRRWAIEKLGGHVSSVTNPSMFGVVERTNVYDMVPLGVQVAIENRMMSIDEYAHTKEYLVRNAKRQLVEAAEPFYEINEDFKNGIITVRLNVYAKR